MRALAAFLATAGLGYGAPAAAEVAATDESGFVVSGSFEIEAAPDEVWAGLIHPEQYWSSEHSWSGDARNMSLDPRAGGCFCEAIPDGGSAEHARVVNVIPGKRLSLRGSLGPLQAEALTGVLTFTLEPAAGGTRLGWTYVVGGYARFPLADIAPAVDGVILEQVIGLLGLFEDRD